MPKPKSGASPKFQLPTDFGRIFVNVLFLLPAIVFWTSVLMYTSLGTDYVFDVVIAELNKTSWGNALMILMVIGGPAMAIAFSGMEYLKTRNKKMKWSMAVGAAFLLLGFFALVKRG